MDSKTSVGDINEVHYHQADIQSVISDDGTTKKTMNNFDCQARHTPSSFHMDVNHGKTCAVCNKGELICTSNPLRDCKVDVLLASIINDGIGDMIRKHSKFKFPITSMIITLKDAKSPDDNGSTNPSIGYGWIIWKYWRVKIPVLIFDRKRHYNKLKMDKKLLQILFDDMGHFHEFKGDTQTHGIKCSLSSNDMNGFVAFKDKKEKLLYHKYIKSKDFGKALIQDRFFQGNQAS
jgi:hypothetical protein